MGRRALTRLAAALVVAVVLGPPEGGPFAPALSPTFSGFSRTLQAQQDEPGSPRARAPLTILQINDVYSTLPVDGMGGLARVATIKQRLKDAGRTPFLILAGDFLSPSVASTVFHGEQMIAALNAAGVDLATLGNHEFDFGDDELIQRMQEANFQWLVANVVDRRTGNPIGGAAPYVVRTFGALKVGFLGLCLTTSEISVAKLTHTDLRDPIAAVARYLPLMKRDGAQVIVAVTHLAFADDRRLVERFPEIDLIVGGHEHFPITGTERRTLISKAGSDARWVARIDVNVRAGGAGRPAAPKPGARAASGGGLVERFFELIPVTDAIPEEPRTAAVVASYEERLGHELDVAVGETTMPLDAESVRLRAREMPIGNLFTDALRAATQADVALMNGGSIRGDRIYPAGPLTKRTLLAIHPFNNVLCKIAVSGAVLLQALNHGVARLPAAAGQFPQLSGLTMAVDEAAPAANRVRDVKVNGAPLDAAKTYTVALPDFVLKGGDGYTMFAGQRVIIAPEGGDLLVAALEKYVAAHSPVNPKVEGRITIVR